LDDIEVVRQVVTIPNLKARFDGMTAVQISDLHLRQTAEVHLRMLEHVRALNPDLVLVTGDLVDRRSAIGQAVDLLNEMHAPRGVWAVPGNWDHHAKAVPNLVDRLKEVNVRLLVNEGAQLDDGFWIVGVDDPASEHDDILRALRDVPPAVPRVLLAHSPDIIRAVRNIRLDLILVGHTHGGQVNLPLFKGAWLHHGASGKYIRGLYRAHGSPMYVNRGIGTTTLPLRLGARPEITHFTFHAA
jgi:predicted MPP superfamily phosphohydrolase